MNHAPITMRARERFVFYLLKEALLQTLEALGRGGAETLETLREGG